MELQRILLSHPSYVEGRLLAYILKRFGSKNDDFSFHKRISVPAPFGKAANRKDGYSFLRPEICITCKKYGIAAEAVAYGDIKHSACKQSESHLAMHKLGLPDKSIYFAQKILCQLLPLVIHIKKSSPKYYAFLSFTENNYETMGFVMEQLVCKSFLKEYKRPLEIGSGDIKQYGQYIYELIFPERLGTIGKEISAILNDTGKEMKM